MSAEYSYEGLVPLTRPLDVVRLDHVDDAPDRFEVVRVPVVGMVVSHATGMAPIWDRDTGRATGRRKEVTTRHIEYVVHDTSGPMHHAEYEEYVGAESYLVGVYEPGVWPDVSDLEFARGEIVLAEKQRQRRRDEIKAGRA